MADHPAPPRRWFSPPEVARQLRVDVHRVLRWVKSGELRAHNLATAIAGRPRWRIDTADLERFLAERRAQPPAVKIRRRRMPKCWKEFV